MSNLHELVRIKLVKQMPFTGTFGGYRFEDSVSEPMLRREAERLSVITSVEFVDSHNLFERKVVERGGDPNAVPEPPQAPSQAVADEGVEQPHKDARLRYTRAQLEKIADERGILGLRQIADPLGIKAVGIKKLVDDILAAQHG